MKKVFIDGSAGTTGLRIYERLGQRRDIELIALPKELRKDSSARRDAINSSDVTFLCLPDDAAREAVEMAENGYNRHLHRAPYRPAVCLRFSGAWRKLF